MGKNAKKIIDIYKNMFKVEKYYEISLKNNS